MVRTRSNQSLSTSAWLGRRRNGTSWTSAMLFSSGSCYNSSPSPRRFPASMYQARSNRSLPTESMVPPVMISATRGKLAMVGVLSYGVGDFETRLSRWILLIPRRYEFLPSPHYSWSEEKLRHCVDRGMSLEE